MENFVCNICSHEFNNSTHKPICLTNCLHTFCNECIEKIDSKKCPACNLDFNNINVNWKILELIDQFDQQNGFEFSCNICFDDYNHSKNKPFMLKNCLHTFCNKCVNSFKEKSCPTCKSGFQDSGPNQMLIDIIAKINSRNFAELQNEIDEIASLLKEFKLVNTSKNIENAFKSTKMQVVSSVEELVKLVNLNKTKLLDELKKNETTNRETLSKIVVDKKKYELRKENMDSMKKLINELTRKNIDLNEKLSILNDHSKIKYEFNKNEKSLRIKPEFVGKIYLKQPKQSDNTQHHPASELLSDLTQEESKRVDLVKSKLDMVANENSSYKLKKMAEELIEENEKLVREVQDGKEHQLRRNKQKMDLLKDMVKSSANDLVDVLIKLQKEFFVELKQMETDYRARLAERIENEEKKIQNDVSLFKAEFNPEQISESKIKLGVIKEQCLESLKKLNTIQLFFVRNENSFNMNTNFIGKITKRKISYMARRSTKFDNEMDTEKKIDSVKFYSSIAHDLVKDNKLKEAIDCYDAASEILPEYYEPLTYKAYCLFCSERYEEALSVFDQSLQLNPACIKTWMGKGQTLARLFYFDEALDCLNLVIKSMSDYELPYIEKADILLKKYELQGALDCIDKAMEIDPSNFSAIELKVKILIGLKKFDDALNLIDSSSCLAKKEEDFLTLHISKAHVMGFSGNEKKANEYLNLAESKFPNSKDLIRRIKGEIQEAALFRNYIRSINDE